MSLAILGLVVAIVSAAMGVITFFPTLASYLESRRQRHLLEASHREVEAVKLAAPGIAAPAVADKKIWSCGIYEYPPLSTWPKRERTPHGPLIEMAQLILNSFGKSAAFQLFTYEDFYKGDDRIPDMVMGMFETKRRSEHVRFSRPFYKIGLQGLCRVGHEGNLLDELLNGDLRVAVHYGEVGWEFVEDELPDVVRQHRSLTLVGGRQLDTMHHLTQGEYDVVIMDYLSCQYFLNTGQHGSRFKIAFNEPLEKFDVCVALAKRHDALISEVNDAIIAVRNSPTFLKLEEEALRGYEPIIERRGLRAVTQRV